MTGISRGRSSRASWLLALLAACGGRAPSTPGDGGTSPLRAIPLSRALVVETAGPPVSDTSVTFTAGTPRAIVLRHGPPDFIAFAELWFDPRAFGADSGREVRVDVHPRPGIYGLDVTSSIPLRPGATVSFKYARFFSGSARARKRYGHDALYERALAVGQVRPDSTLVLLPSTRPAADVLNAPLPASGSYIVAAPE
ncbi:MAG TPA: hypothetical protein VEB59_09180 [Gemmatimonadales bacterium]|nr:hypothetical protein [Gemmatimonadales bacterium]